MNSLEQAIEVTAQRCHERSEDRLYKDAQKLLESIESDGDQWEDARLREGYVEHCKEVIECGPLSWEDYPEFGKEIARKRVRQTVIDCLPAFLYAEAEEATSRSEYSWTTDYEWSHLRWTVGYLNERAEEIENESGN